MNRLRHALLALLMLGPATLVIAQQVEAGDTLVHYAAMRTTDLDPAMATRYGVRRSAERGMLMLSPKQRTDNGNSSLPGTARGTATNLIGHRQDLAFREVQEGDVLYLIATFAISHLEYLNFDVQFVPRGEHAAVDIEFSRQFFTD